MVPLFGFCVDIQDTLKRIFPHSIEISKQAQVGRKRRCHLDRSSYSRLADNFELGRECRRSLAHATQSKPKQVAALHKTAAVVFNGETDKTSDIGKRNVQMAWF